MNIRFLLISLCISACLFADEMIVDMDRAIDDVQACGLNIVDGQVPTVVEIINGAKIATESQATTNVRGSSSLLLRAGEIGGTINARNSSEVVVTGGQFVRDDISYPTSPILVGHDASMIRVSLGGYVVPSPDYLAFDFDFETPMIAIDDSSRLVVDGGEIHSFWTGVQARGHSTLDLFSGGIHGDETWGIHAVDFATINLHGGIVEADVPIVAMDDSSVFYNGADTSSTEDYDSLRLHDRAQVNVAAGGHGWLTALDQSHVHVTGGSATVSLQGQANADISGGRIANGVEVGRHSVLNLWNGQVLSERGNVALAVGGVANIWGGEIHGDEGILRVGSQGVLHLRGGTFSNADDEEIDLIALGDSTVHFYGSGLADDGTSISGILDGQPFSLTYQLRDSARIEFHEPSSVPCDLDDDGACDTDDIDLLGQAIEAGAFLARFDLTTDGLVDGIDQAVWLDTAATTNGLPHPYQFGDANLDGRVDSVDLNIVGVNWQARGRVWSSGNFVHAGREDDFGKVDSSDLNALAANWEARGANAVPEPNGYLLSWWLLLMAAFCRRSMG